MITLLQIVTVLTVLGIAYEIGVYCGHRSAERIFRDRMN